MANILCVWELGSGLGHLSTLKPFIEQAQARGHTVSLALKELHNVPVALPGFSGAVFQAPYLSRASHSTGSLLSYSQIILQRCASDNELAVIGAAWQAIFDATRPDLVIYNFAPTALIASLSQNWQKWVVGTGFEIPRTDLPFFGLLPRVADNPANRDILAHAEEQLLTQINTYLRQRQREPIDSPAALFQQAEHQLLLTLPETDHYGARPEAEYLGVPATADGLEPRWKGENGYRVFAYLLPFARVDAVLSDFADVGAQLCIYGPHLSPATRERFPQFHFSPAPLDMQAVLAGADLAVTMGGHNTGCHCFLSGLPQLMFPPRQEQYLFARRVAHAGRGVWAHIGEENTDRVIAEAIGLAQNRVSVDTQYVREMSGEGLSKRIEELLDSL